MEIRHCNILWITSNVNVFTFGVIACTFGCGVVGKMGRPASQHIKYFSCEKAAIQYSVSVTDLFALISLFAASVVFYCLLFPLIHVFERIFP